MQRLLVEESYNFLQLPLFKELPVQFPMIVPLIMLDITAHEHFDNTLHLVNRLLIFLGVLTEDIHHFGQDVRLVEFAVVPHEYLVESCLVLEHVGEKQHVLIHFFANVGLLHDRDYLLIVDLEVVLQPLVVFSCHFFPADQRTPTRDYQREAGHQVAA
jgi:hypothetical protein